MLPTTFYENALMEYDPGRTWVVSPHCTPQAAMLAHRKGLGLLNYEKCTVRELHTFAARRRLSISPMIKKKGGLVRLLQNADQENTFEKLLDLPPELRLLIYEFYLAPFEFQGGSMVAPPPLCQSSSLLRKESLPLFGTMYSHVILIALKSNEGPASSNPDDYDVCPREKKFLANAPDERLAAIKNVFFIVRVQESERYWYRWNCQLLESRQKYEMTSDHVLLRVVESGEEEVMKKTEERLKALLEGFGTRSEGVGFRRGDIDALSEVWRGALRDMKAEDAGS